MRVKDPGIHTYKRLISVGIIGILIGIIVTLLGWGRFALLVGWDTAIFLYVLWAWLTTLRLDGPSTKTHAVREDPGRAVTDILLVTTSVVSLGAVLLLILDASQVSGLTKALDIAIGLASIVLSWFLVQTTFAIKYARLFYGNTEHEVEFNEKTMPSYSNFVYLAFTVGMTYQVSDTNIQTKLMRSAVLRQAMLSYLYGTVIIATTISTLTSLTK